MKLNRSQSLVSSPQPPTTYSTTNQQYHHETNIHGISGVEIANLSSSSSSSLTSNSNMLSSATTTNTTTHTPTHRSNTVVGMSASTASMSHQQLPRMNSSQALRQYQRNLSISTHMASFGQQQQQQQQHSSSGAQPMPLVSHHRHFNGAASAISPLVGSQIYLICNRCGKSLTTISTNTTTNNSIVTERLNGSASSHQLAAATFNLSSSLTGAGAGLSTVVQSAVTSAASKEAVNTANEPNLIGCLNCAHFLPQCTICLRIMKINLLPVPQQSN